MQIRELSRKLNLLPLLPNMHLERSYCVELQCFAFRFFFITKVVYNQKLKGFSLKKQETYAVRFVARKNKVANNKKSPLSVRITVNAQRVEMSLGWYVTKSIWDEKMQKCKGSTREAKGTNGFIDATIFKLTDIRQLKKKK